MAAVVDTGIVNEDIAYILRIGGIMLAIAVAGVGLSIAASYFSAKISAGFGKRIRDQVFAHVENFTLQEFNQFGTSSLMTRTTNDVMQVQQVLTMMLKVFIIAPLMFIGAIIFAVIIDPVLSLVLFIPLPIIILVVLVISKKSIPMFKSLKIKTDWLNVILRDALSGVKTIRSFNQTEHERVRFDKTNSEYSDTAIKVNRKLIQLTPIMMDILNFSIIALIWFGSFRIEAGNLQVGNLMAFIQYAMLIMFSLIMASVMIVAIPRAAVAAGRINEVLDKSPIIENDGFTPARSLQGNIKFHNVSFRFPGAADPVLSNISFTAEQGKVTAITGGTGSGKSTLIQVIMRLYEIDEGTIQMNGMNIRYLDPQALRAQIRYVPQKPVLFQGTILENIRYGKSSLTEEEAFRAADIAQASSFIKGLDNGIHSPVSRKGGNLSGGQRQRIAIARAIVGEPSIYLFDDSFSALDNKTSLKVRRELQEETKDAAVIMASQNVNAIVDADQIIVMDKGTIAGIGKHEELIRTCQAYRELVSTQSTRRQAT